ncbi:MAG: hypothetical protein GY816_04720, partial [Cytophagales bacterium]|nr:hypothetical protein [Cytophagales bacterium]
GLLQLNRTYENAGNVLNFITKDGNRHGDFRFKSEKTDNNTTKTIMFLDGDQQSVGIGTESTGTHTLAVDGSIHAEEVLIDLNVQGPDYVFEPSYDLRTLEETEEFITTNKHLPEVPSAKEMEENGIVLGEMNMLLLKKIEELTLYLIEQNKQLSQQNKTIEKLQKQVDQLSESAN